MLFLNTYSAVHLVFTQLSVRSQAKCRFTVYFRSSTIQFRLGRHKHPRRGRYIFQISSQGFCPGSQREIHTRPWSGLNLKHGRKSKSSNIIHITVTHYQQDSWRWMHRRPKSWPEQILPTWSVYPPPTQMKKHFVWQLTGVFGWVVTSQPGGARAQLIQAYLGLCIRWP